MPSQRRGSRRGLPQVAHFNLFDDQDQELGPQWRQLPPATQVTDLMVRLLSEYRRSDGPGAAEERCDD